MTANIENDGLMPPRPQRDVERIPVVTVRQSANAPRIRDVAQALGDLLDGFGLPDKVRAGERIALTAGSRGIRDYPDILRAIAVRLSSLGAKPFIVPCMGSHGGGEAASQIALLADLGISEATMGVPVVASDSATEIGSRVFGSFVAVATSIASADKIMVINRVKPHTDFGGQLGSGLLKMMTIGMGGRVGAVRAHRLAVDHGFERVLVATGSAILRSLPVVGGIAIVENERHETAILEVVEPQDFLEREKELLATARSLMPSIPFDGVHILIVDEMGKDLSGAGMDTNVIGRFLLGGRERRARPHVERLVVRSLTAASRGNASGIGLADFTTMRLLDAVDQTVTRENCLTSLAPEYARLPIAFDTDQEAVAAAYETCSASDLESCRLVWIRNTLDTTEMRVSPACLAQQTNDTGLLAVGRFRPLPFDSVGNLHAEW